MRVTLRFFAATRDAVGQGQVPFEAPEGCTVGQLRDEVFRRWPTLAAWEDHLLVSVNQAYAGPAARLREGDEVAFFPPVSGGGAVRLQEDDFSVDEVVAATAQDGAGAVCTFTGVVRPENLGAEVRGITFESYGAMAQRELERLAGQAREKFGLVDCSIVHRTGTLGVGARICVVVASARHREAAFEACRWVMEELKRVVPIWKREHASGGDRWL